MSEVGEGERGVEGVRRTSSHFHICRWFGGESCRQFFVAPRAADWGVKYLRTPVACPSLFSHILHIHTHTHTHTHTHHPTTHTRSTLPPIA